VGFIWGVGKASQARLQRDGYNTIADLQRADENDLMRRYGVEGRRLWRLSRGIDDRPVNPERETRSVSAETTFNEDIASYKPLERLLWSLSEKVSARLKAGGIAGSTVTLKLKSADFRIRTRARSLAEPTQLAARIFDAGRELLAREIDGTRFRLIGIGLSNLDDGGKADAADLIDLKARRTAEAEHAVDKVREKFGKAAVVKGLVFDGAERHAEADEED
jgi:DNA polymerase-4